MERLTDKELRELKSRAEYRCEVGEWFDSLSAHDVLSVVAELQGYRSAARGFEGRARRIGFITGDRLTLTHERAAAINLLLSDILGAPPGPLVPPERPGRM